MSPGEIQIKRLEGIAIWMAPALRDKFDFSDDKDYDALAKMAFRAAESIVKESDSRLAVVLKSEKEELDKSKSAQEVVK